MEDEAICTIGGRWQRRQALLLPLALHALIVLVPLPAAQTRLRRLMMRRFAGMPNNDQRGLSAALEPQQSRRLSIQHEHCQLTCMWANDRKRRTRVRLTLVLPRP
jgi:hypothetical protein